MRHVELSGLLPLAAPRFDEAAVLVELEHPRIAARDPRSMPLDDEHVPVGGDGDIVRLIQLPCASGLVPLPASPLVPIVSNTSPAGFSFTTVCAPTSVAHRFPSRSILNPCERVNIASPNARTNAPVWIELEEGLGAARQHLDMAPGVECHRGGGAHLRAPAGSVMAFGTAT